MARSPIIISEGRGIKASSVKNYGTIFYPDCLRFPEFRPKNRWFFFPPRIHSATLSFSALVSLRRYNHPKVQSQEQKSMGSLNAILNEAGAQFGLSSTKATSLLSSFFSMINDMPGGFAAFLDRFRKVGLGDSVSSWISGSSPRPISGTTLENAVGHDWLDKIASKAGLSYATASSALAFMIPSVVQRLTPGGVIPNRLPTDALNAAATGPNYATTAREAAYTTERTVRKAGTPGWLWPLLALLALFLIGYWIWGGSRQAVNHTTFNIEEQSRLAAQRASSALAALKPGYTARDLVTALNLNVINFPSGSAEIPPDSMNYLNHVALAIKSAPSGTVLEIGGHTDNTGDAGANMNLSQQRADAVRNYLVQQGVASNMLVSKGYGDTRPVGSNDTDEGKFRNRRIEFTVQ
jgi:outer membrane protein OmpA-like peptidoglycan-associated protein/uncharacterized protein YidB (DUF937 family)